MKTQIDNLSVQLKMAYTLGFAALSVGLLFLGLLFSPLLIGIPIAVFAIITLFISPYMGFTLKKVECPKCHAMNFALMTMTSVKCKDCKEKILIRKNEAILSSSL